jgi:hypothetical protein
VERRVERAATHLLDIWPLVIPLAFHPADLEGLVVVAPDDSGSRASQVEHISLALPALLFPPESMFGHRIVLLVLHAQALRPVDSTLS